MIFFSVEKMYTIPFFKKIPNFCVGWQALKPGLPDFSRYNIPKRGKYTKWPQNIPNGHKIFPMAIK
jgi:hypothetical protein